MRPARHPADEEYRLATLHAHAILDSPADVNFDRLTELAAEHFGVPIAVVSLVDQDRQWFKAAIGVAVCETARDISFCAHAILCPENVLVVEDALRDPRFSDNPLVIGAPFVRFYAGAPILAENGQPLGSLCIIDHRPGALDEAGQRYLRHLACLAGALLTLHRKTHVLLHAATTDPLTGVNNRRGFDARLAEAVAKCDDHACGLLCVDLDDFKGINDRWGHDAGDAVLKEAAMRLSSSVRPSDCVARLGGDEFAVLIAGPVDEHVARLIATRFIGALTREFRVGDALIPIAASVGLALAPEHARDATALLRRADQALYDAKRTGGRIAAAGPAGVSRGSLAGDVMGALRRNEFRLTWTPIVALATATLAGQEATVGWMHPEQGALSADALRAACGPGTELDLWLLGAALRQAASGTQDVAVTLSTCWLCDPDTPRLLNETLRQHHVMPDRVLLQFTEAAIAGAGARATDRLAALKALGVKLAITGWGVGQGSLPVLRLPAWDQVVLHTEHTAGLGTDARAEMILLGMLRLCDALGLQMRATGVDSEAQRAFLRDAGCAFAQGGLFAVPREAERQALEAQAVSS